MIGYDKIAVFDLDDTLYIGNSHLEWLCWYYDTRVFDTLAFKAIGRLFPSLQKLIMWKLYNKAPIDSKVGFILEFRKRVIDILEAKSKEGYLIIILSNAPEELIKNAAIKLNVDYLCADINKKAESLCKNYKFKQLFVCTDNKTDIDLLDIANDAVITCKERNRGYFIKKLSSKNIKYVFLEDD